jgi:glucose/arabinose dehydrogenase
MANSSKPCALAIIALFGVIAVAGAQTAPVLTGASAYGDWHIDAPGIRRRITPADMPLPYASPSANRHPDIAARPAGAWPKAPPGFAVELWATGLEGPRLLWVSPGGDIFVAESRAGRIRVGAADAKRRSA